MDNANTRQPDHQQETKEEETRHLWDGSPWPNYIITPTKPNDLAAENTEGQRPQVRLGRRVVQHPTGENRCLD